MTNVKKQRMQGRKKMHLELGEVTEIIKFKHTSETKEDWPVRWASAGCLRRGGQQRLWAWRNQELVPRSFSQSALGLDPGPSRTSTRALKRRGVSCLLVLSLGGVSTIWSARRRSAESRQSKLGGGERPGALCLWNPAEQALSFVTAAWLGLSALVLAKVLQSLNLGHIV